ncbi:FAD-binding protein [Pseudooceanicola nitratireducens]|uniref:FAD-binding protein n=1 Tax=Pseudooceanicola nitratireducens TaxID=517719 RepID=UPI001C988AC8|nr:FAD-binding protein [Pseudooceanicola nitratireducens]MBY6164319.1 FAD-binding protein [Pseudooceanicola nitratireducens]
MIRPENEAQLAEAIRDAGGALSIRGGATRGLSPAGDAVETSGLHGVRLYEPGALTLVVGAGTPMDDIDTILGEKNQRLAFEPMDHRALLGTSGVPTIGGVAAANVSGPRRLQVGAARDHMLGVRFVTGTGEVVKNGGRVMKNVTGYDLVKVLAGSYGTLGVLSEVSLKVQAIPEAQATLVLRGQGMSDALVDLMRAMSTPYDVSGAAYVSSVNGKTGSERRIRVEGMAGSVAYRAGKLADLLGADAVIEGEDSAALWQELRDVTPFAGRNGAVWKVSTRPSRAAGLSQALTDGGQPHEVIADWSGGLLWLLVPEAGDLGAAAIRAAVAQAGGHATLIRGDLARTGVTRFQSQGPIQDRLAAGLRARFDPSGILNAGLMDMTKTGPGADAARVKDPV